MAADTTDTALKPLTDPFAGSTPRTHVIGFVNAPGRVWRVNATLTRRVSVVSAPCQWFQWPS